MGEGPSCPQCGTAVQPDWDWCMGCGWDPEGRRPAAPAAVGVPPAPLEQAAPAPPAPPAWGAAPPPGPAGWAPPPPPPPAPATGRGSLAYKVVVGVVAAALLLVVVPVLAIVFLGTESDDAVDLGGLTVDEETGTVTDALGNQLEVEQQGPVVEGVEPLDDGWVRYEEPAGAFAIDLPSQPTETTAEVPVPFGSPAQARSLSAPAGRGVVVANLVLLADLGLTSADGFDLDASLEGSALSTGGSLAEVTTIEVHGWEGRRARIDLAGAPGGGAELVVVATDQALVQVLGLGALDDFERSLASLELP